MSDIDLDSPNVDWRDDVAENGNRSHVHSATLRSVDADTMPTWLERQRRKKRPAGKRLALYPDQDKDPRLRVLGDMEEA